MRQGLSANEMGSPSVARAKFVAAYGHSRRPSTLVAAAARPLTLGARG